MFIHTNIFIVRLINVQAVIGRVFFGVKGREYKIEGKHLISKYVWL